jgi:hypothetical protein
MPYNLAIAAAEIDADMYQNATIEQDAENSRIIVLVGADIVAIYPYRN